MYALIFITGGRPGRRWPTKLYRIKAVRTFTGTGTQGFLVTVSGKSWRRVSNHHVWTMWEYEPTTKEIRDARKGTPTPEAMARHYPTVFAAISGNYT